MMKSLRRIERRRHAHLLRDRDQLVGVVQGVQVGAADAARLDRDQRVARTEHRLGDVLDDEDTTTGDGGTHTSRLTGAAADADRMSREPNRGFAGLGWYVGQPARGSRREWAWR